MPDASQFERHNVHKRRVYCHTWERLPRGMHMMVDVMSRDMFDTVAASSVKVGTKGYQKRCVRRR